MSDATDLFGHPAGPPEASLFGVAENRLQAPEQNFSPDPEIVRRRLNALLATARRAGAMPWPERDTRMWQTVFPNMAKLLPADEAEQPRLDLAREMERLKAVA
jgi:hypothetical protein